MRLSMPMPSATSSTSAPVFSQTLAPPLASIAQTDKKPLLSVDLTAIHMTSSASVAPKRNVPRKAIPDLFVILPKHFP